MSKKYIIFNLKNTNKLIFLVFLGALSYVSLTFVERESKFFDEENYHPIIYTISYSLGLCLSFILLIIYKIQNKRKNKKKILLIESGGTVASHSLSDVKKITHLEKFLWLLLVAIIDFIVCLLNCIFWVNMNNYFNSWATTVIALSILSYWILKMKLYKHHYISIISIDIMGILYNVLSNRFDSDIIGDNYIFYLIFSFGEILAYISYVLYKYLMYIKYIKSYEILFYQGLIELPLSIITLIITTSIGKIDNFWDYYDQLDSTEIIVFIFLVIINFIYASNIYIIIDIFSPFHVFILYILSDTMTAFLHVTQVPYKIFIFAVILLIFSMIMSLIFVEVIELNFCDISKMTKRNIHLRAKLEKSLSIENNEKDLINDEEDIDYKGYLIELRNEDTNELQDKNIFIDSLGKEKD